MVNRRQLAVLFGILGLMAAISHIGGEVFTAIVEMEKLLKAENSVAQDLKQYVAKEEARLAKLKSIADDYEQHSATALADVEHYLGNPVNAFLLVKRFTTDWEHIVNTYIRTNNSDDVLAAIASKTALFPEQADLEGAVTALLRLQDTYALPASKIADGQLAVDVVSPVMSSADCFEIGRLAYMSKDYYHTILWMEQSMRALEREDLMSHTRTTNPTEILDYLAYAMYMQGNIQHALNLTIEWLKYEPDHERAQRNKMYYEQMLRQEEAAMGGATQEAPPPALKNERPRDAYRSSQEFDDYERLCRGEETRANPHAHKLTCRYVRHHPIFYLSPVKEETVYLEPWIAVYRDVLTEREISKIKELATPRLNRATVSNPQTGVLEFANYRVSKSAWLKDDEHVLINRVTMKTVAITNLTTTTVEELQVVNYGIGGHYEPHYDFARSHERNAFDEWRGNRIATVIFYMSDVAAGGATVFPDLGVKLWPEKGACAVWFNLLKNGDGDLRTRHAACPVLTGSKWVCNKWYHERGQEFARPCSTDPNE